MIPRVQLSQEKAGPKWDNTDSRTIKTTRAQREKLTKASICQEDTTVWMCTDHFSMHGINTDRMKRKSGPRPIPNCSGDSPHRRPRHWIQKRRSTTRQFTAFLEAVLNNSTGQTHFKDTQTCQNEPQGESTSKSQHSQWKHTERTVWPQENLARCQG